ncbi:MAG: inorganic pyrophosphatase [Bacteroidia bacterium]|jgi:inorganic pyrophosphatase
MKYRAHPWHGISLGNNFPEQVNVYIEIVPSDTVKYEIDKESGYLKIDRPQKFSNIIPALYGFIPQTYCGKTVAALSSDKTGKGTLKGDGDPLDICVLSERNITHGDILLRAIPIGGFRLIDRGEADDKIIAVMANDEVYREFKDLNDCPEAIVNRLKHYFLTYKNMPGLDHHICEITEAYGKEEALEVIKRSAFDYETEIKPSI